MRVSAAPGAYPAIDRILEVDALFVAQKKHFAQREKEAKEQTRLGKK